MFLGANNLAVGSNNLSTTFSGVIQDGGSLTKIGTGKLILTNANTYTGGTTVTSGVLLSNNASGSGTGTGAVTVNGGTLGGSGIIAGAVTVGTNTHATSFLAPSKGAKKPATLTIQGALMLNDDATYLYKLDTKHRMVATKHGRADQVLADGVTIDGGAKFSFRPIDTKRLPVGQVFTVISNTAPAAISGTFHNLPDGAVVTVNGNNLQAELHRWRRQRSHADRGAVACAPSSRSHSPRSPRNPRSHACCQLSRVDSQASFAGRQDTPAATDPIAPGRGKGRIVLQGPSVWCELFWVCPRVSRQRMMK